MRSTWVLHCLTFKGVTLFLFSLFFLVVFPLRSVFFHSRFVIFYWFSSVVLLFLYCQRITYIFFMYFALLISALLPRLPDCTGLCYHRHPRLLFRHCPPPLSLCSPFIPASSFYSSWIVPLCFGFNWDNEYGPRECFADFVPNGYASFRRIWGWSAGCIIYMRFLETLGTTRSYLLIYSSWIVSCCVSDPPLFNWDEYGSRECLRIWSQCFRFISQDSRFNLPGFFLFTLDS